MVAALGASIDHLFVGEHRAERRAPVHRHFGDIRQPLFVELLEYPLRPSVVFGVGGVDLAVPIIGEAEHPDLLAESVDVLLRRDGRMRSRLHGILLRRQPKCIPSHRVQHVEALHSLVTAEDIRSRVAFGMTDMEPRPGRIREHIQTVELRFLRVPGVALERLVFKPIRLPFLLDGGKVIVHFSFFFQQPQSLCRGEHGILVVKLIDRFRRTICLVVINTPTIENRIPGMLVPFV